MNGPLNRLRVLHVMSGDLWAGAEAQACALLKELSRNPSFELRAALFNPGELEMRLRQAGIPVSVFDERSASSWRIALRLRQLVREFDPHVVHTHGFKENVLGGLAARSTGHRTSLRTVHGAPEHRPPPWRVDKQLARVLDDWAETRWQQASVAVSDDLGSRLRRQRTGIRVEVIHNGLDLAEFDKLRQRHSARLRDRSERVAFIGRLVPVKRVDLFLEAAGILVERDRGRWHFDIIGDGPLREELGRSAAAKALAAQVTFHGFRSDAVEMLPDCDVLAFTSDHEGTPMAALEALAVGVPVVARAVGGLVEMLTGLRGCRLVDSDQPEVIAAAIEACVESGERPELPPRYSISTCAKGYEALYARLVSGGVRPHDGV